MRFMTHATLSSSLVSLIAVAALGCGSSSSSSSSGGEVATGNAAGAQRAKQIAELAADLDRPIDVQEKLMMLRWMGVRYDEARTGSGKRVRVPLVRRAAKLQDDSPEWAIATSPKEGPFYWVSLVDRTGQIPTGDWKGWAEGRFSGAEVTYTSRDSGVSMQLPVLEVSTVQPRGGEVAEVRVLGR